MQHLPRQSQVFARALARFVAPTVVALFAVVGFYGAVNAQTVVQTDIPGPVGSGAFGSTVAVLPNGNFVVADPSYDAPFALDVGSVALYDGATLALISRLTGSIAHDAVGEGITVLANGNFVVVSPHWSNGSAVNAGAVTWGSAILGITGTVSASNSIVGSALNDYVGVRGVTALANGNYVVVSDDWNSPSAIEAGAVTWGDGTNGSAGTVSAANSLVGASDYDHVGNGGVRALANGNYVVSSWLWNNSSVGASGAGAATWGNGATGVTGLISSSNSLVGIDANHNVGKAITALTNGNYVVVTPDWNIGMPDYSGAVTWANGTVGITGTITVTNSLVGGQYDDKVGSEGVFALTNGNYVVVTTGWDNGAVFNAGAATWGNGAKGITGTVSITNSIVGSKAYDHVGHGGVLPLTNGNYVVLSQSWEDAGGNTVGAVTWGNGATGSAMLVSTANSLVGVTHGDAYGLALTALANGNYVAAWPAWDNGAVVEAGAVTWVDGSAPRADYVNGANSLVGSQENDRVGGYGVFALTNGNYVVASPQWRNGAEAVAGAATWGNGASGVTGVVSQANSLVGTHAVDGVGLAVQPLANGNYVVRSPLWNSPAVAGAGAVTWADGATGLTGVVTTTNSLVGSSPNDRVGFGTVVTAPNGNYYVTSPFFDGPATDSGAVTPGVGQGGTTGSLSASNSVLGTAAGGGAAMTASYNAQRSWLAVGRPADNIVTIVGFEWLLDVVKAGTGSGSVTSLPSGIDCGNICSASIAESRVVTLTAVANPSSTFTGWSGDCTGTGACVVTMTQARNVTATFSLKTYALTVNTAGSGSGAVSGAPGNPIAHGTVVTLTASANTGSTFTGWSGDCAGTGACVVTMTQARNVTATFDLNTVDPNTHVLTINIAGTGSGTVGGAPANPIAHGTVVTLTATPATGSSFGGWSGDCSGTGACVVTMVAAKTVTATFTLQPPDVDEVEVDISPAGPGGTVMVEVITDTVAVGAALMPVRVAATEETYPVGTVLRLTALPYLGYAFDGWGGHVSGTLNPLEVVVTQPLVVTAAFVVADVFLPAVSK